MSATLLLADVSWSGAMRRARRRVELLILLVCVVLILWLSVLSDAVWTLPPRAPTAPHYMGCSSVPLPC